MEFALVAAVVAVTVVVVANRRRPRLDLDPRDRAELDALGAALLAEDRALRDPVLTARLRTLVGRGVPARSVEPTGIRGQWVLRFADSTPVLVHERHAGDMAVLGMRLLSHRVRLASWTPVAAGVLVELVWRGGRMRALAVA